MRARVHQFELVSKTKEEVNYVLVRRLDCLTLSMAHSVACLRSLNTGTSCRRAKSMR